MVFAKSPKVTFFRKCPVQVNLQRKITNITKLTLVIIVIIVNLLMVNYLKIIVHLYKILFLDVQYNIT